MRLNGARRVTFLAGLLGTVVLVGMGGLTVWAVVGVERVNTMAHQEVAQRLFDGMEDELSTLVAQEESRSFLEYRTFYVPEGAGDAVVRSPLSEGPSSVAVKGYFQIEPDGTVQLPGDLADNELALAEQQGWSPNLKSTARNGVVNDIVSKVSNWTQSNPRVELPEEGVERLNNRGVQRRVDRAEQNFAVGTSNANVYQQREMDAPSPEAIEPDANALAAIDVRVTPMLGQVVEDGLLLHRTVTVAGETYRQGLVLDPDELASLLEERVLIAAGLPEVQLSWGPHPPPGRWVFAHAFAPPFQDLRVLAGVTPIAGVVGIEGPLLRGVVVVLLLTVVAVGAALSLAVRAELQFAQRRSDFVAAVSHELRTPLTSIRMYAEMLRDGMVPDPERQRTYHATITSESERLSRLIGNVLELARLETGQVKAEPVMGDVAQVIDEAVTMLTPHASAQGVEIRVTIETELPAVRIDRDALIQVMMNLIDNAVKFGGTGHVEVEAASQGKGVVVRVRDHGPGVPGQQLPLIFDAFYRGERELTRTTKGTGIGLALVAGLVRDMGGQVVARNHPEGGLVVAVVLTAGVAAG